MNKPKITLTTCDSGDWEILEMSLKQEESELYFNVDGHSLSNQSWIGLLNKLGYEVEEKCISDEEMEELC